MKRLFNVWEDTWRQWIEPEPFKNFADPLPSFPGSKFCIEQYALGHALVLAEIVRHPPTSTNTCHLAPCAHRITNHATQGEEDILEIARSHIVLNTRNPNSTGQASTNGAHHAGYAYVFPICSLVAMRRRARLTPSARAVGTVREAVPGTARRAERPSSARRVPACCPARRPMRACPRPSSWPRRPSSPLPQPARPTARPTSAPTPRPTLPPTPPPTGPPTPPTASPLAAPSPTSARPPPTSTSATPPARRAPLVSLRARRAARRAGMPTPISPSTSPYVHTHTPQLYEQ